ncbi:hypothetical protein SUGI_0425770 [Cryptomeria japonica]|nr:hypothetical protein SUGI_0425770 [Cryptomeria japonica]
MDIDAEIKQGFFKCMEKFDAAAIELEVYKQAKGFLSSRAALQKQDDHPTSCMVGFFWRQNTKFKVDGNKESSRNY